MNYSKILKGILEIGEEMVECGAENYRVEEGLYRMCQAYDFTRVNVFVIPSNIQITVETKEGDFITQIRQIESSEFNFDRLDYLNNLCRYVSEHAPDEIVIKEKFTEVMNRPKQPGYVRLLAGVLGGTGFAVFFGSTFFDALVAVIVSSMIVIVGDWLGKHEKNLFLYNCILAFLSEVIILGANRLGIGVRPDCTMIGIVMLLISGLGIVNGIRELMQRDFLSGTLNIMNSVLGAMGIAIGIAGAMLLFKNHGALNFIIAHSEIVQLISCTIACVGFAMWFQVRYRQVVYSGIGAFISWAIYLFVYNINESNFFATMISALFVFLYAYITSRINKAPSTIFLTASVFPLVPGPNLYYMMSDLVDGEIAHTTYQFAVLMETCFAIALGFIFMDFILRFYKKARAGELF